MTSTTVIDELKKSGKADLREIATLAFEQDRLSKDTFDLIRAEKGKKGNSNG